MIHRSRRILNNQGASLVQVMAAVAITALLGLFVMQMIFEMKKVEVLMTLQAQVTDHELHIQRALMDPDACFETIKPAIGARDIDFPLTKSKGINFPIIYGPYYMKQNETKPFKLFEVSDPAITPDAKNQRLFLREINLVRVRLYDKNITPPKFPESGIVTIYMQLVFQQAINEVNPTATKLDTGGRFITRYIPLTVHTNKLMRIAKCSSISQKDLGKDFCESLGLVVSAADGKCTLDKAPPIVKTVCNALGMGTDSAGTKCQ